MGLDIAAIQQALCDDELDGGLLYDFHGSNPIARGLVGLAASGALTTRRWYYLIPASGTPRDSSMRSSGTAWIICQERP